MCSKKYTTIGVEKSKNKRRHYNDREKKVYINKKQSYFDILPNVVLKFKKIIIGYQMSCCHCLGTQGSSLYGLFIFDTYLYNVNNEDKRKNGILTFFFNSYWGNRSCSTKSSRSAYQDSLHWRVSKWLFPFCFFYTDT